MEFDPLEWFTPEQDLRPAVEFVPRDPETYTSEPSEPSDSVNPSDLSVFQDPDTPLYIHDLPLLRSKPPAVVLLAFLRLFAPNKVLNFGPVAEQEGDMLEERGIPRADAESAVRWLGSRNARFTTVDALGHVTKLAPQFKHAFSSQYNSWLTSLVSCPFEWLTESEVEQIQSLAAFRLAENCGRTAQPEFVRHISIPHLSQTICLKEPSLTADNLGLKTWGSSFVLASRIAAKPAYLAGNVLELGAGTGLVGMSSCIIGHVTTLTDLPQIVPNLQDNLQLNHISAQTDTLDWSCPDSFLEKHGHVKYETVILSDPVYSSAHPPWIVNMVKLFLSRDPKSRVLLQVPIRQGFHAERELLWRLMTEAGLEVAEDATEHGHDDFGQSAFSFRMYHWKTHNT